MQTVGLNVILGADFSSAEDAMAKFRQSVNALAAQTAKAFSDMAGTAASIGNAFKPVSDGARNATQVLISESKLRQQADTELTQWALNSSKLKIQALRDEAAESRKATQAKKAEKDAYATLVADVQATTRAYYNAAAAALKNKDATEETTLKLKQMAAAALTGNEQLKSIEAGAGRFQRNVGNYSGATQYLQQSIAQLSGEIPNFFQSMRIGFMSIGNNIQPITQAIKLMREENIKLAESGKPVKNITNELIKGFLGWQTLMLVGVGIISAYGGKILDWATGADKTKAAAKALAEQQKELDQIVESSNKTAGDQIGKLTTLNATITNSATPMAKRKQAYNELQKLYPSYLSNLTQEQALNGGLANIINTQLVPAIIAAAKARAYQGQINLLATKGIDLDKQVADQALKTAAASVISEKATKRLAEAKKDNGNGSAAEIALHRELKKSLQEDADQYTIQSKKLEELNKLRGDNTNTISKMAGEIIGLGGQMGKLNSDGIDPLTKHTKTAKEHVDDLTKSSNKLAETFRETLGLLQGGFLTQLQALQKNADAVKEHLKDLWGKGGAQADIIATTNALVRLNYEIANLKPIDLTSAKGSDPEKDFHQYIEGLEEIKKRAKELSGNFYNVLGIQDPRDAVKRRQLATDLEGKGIDSSQFIDPDKSAKGQADDLKKGGQGLNREFNKTYSILNKLVGGPMDSFVGAIFDGKNAFESLGNSIKDVVKEMIAAIAKAAIFTGIMSLINPTSLAAGGGFMGILKGLIPFAATGGVVTGPTVAMVGEAGPEAIIPLNKLGSMMGGQNLNITINSRLRGRDLDQAIVNQNTYSKR